MVFMLKIRRDMIYYFISNNYPISKQTKLFNQFITVMVFSSHITFILNRYTAV